MEQEKSPIEGLLAVKKSDRDSKRLGREEELKMQEEFIARKGVTRLPSVDEFDYERLQRTERFKRMLREILNRNKPASAGTDDDCTREFDRLPSFEGAIRQETPRSHLAQPERTHLNPPI